MWPWLVRWLVRLLFPVVFLWNVMKFAFNQLIGKAMGKLVLPAQDAKFDPAVCFGKIRNAKGFRTEYIYVATHDRVKLDTVEVHCFLNEAKDIRERQYIIRFNGNGGCHQEFLEQIQSDAVRLGFNVVGFNYRGVGNSTGSPRSKDDLVADGIAQVQRILDTCVDPENIILKGFSLGAGIATLVAEHFHDKGQRVNLFHDRSFSSITGFVIGHIRTKQDGHTETIGRKIVGWVVWPFVKLFLELSGWEIDAASAYKKIPVSHKEHMLVRSSKIERDAGRIDDFVIPYYASLHYALKNDGREKKKYLTEVDRVQAKARKMQSSSLSVTVNAHKAHPMDLISRYNGQTGLHFFDNFIKRVQQHHALKLDESPACSR